MMQRHLLRRVTSRLRCSLFQTYCTPASKPSAATQQLPDELIDDPDYSEVPQYPQDIPSHFDDKLRNIGREDREYLNKWLPYERKLLANMVKHLPSAKEKIDFINPYERPWRVVERRRHRLWRRPLDEPRQAFFLNPVPAGYNSLNMYKFVTQTHCINGLPEVYNDVKVSKEQIAHFREKLEEMLKSEIEGRKEFYTAVDFIIDQLVNNSIAMFSGDYEHLKNVQIGTNVRYETFVERGGFGELYHELKNEKELKDERKKLEKKRKKLDDEKSVKKEEKLEETISMYKEKRLPKLPCDCYYEMGELSFCFRDVATAQIRSSLPLPQVQFKVEELAPPYN